MSNTSNNGEGPSPAYKEDTIVGSSDVGNEKAFKGDDSDGAVEWTLKTSIAAITLGCLYTGMWFCATRRRS